jgi:hypothetical protein
MKFFNESEHYEMFRMHSFVGATFENALAFMYGVAKDDIVDVLNPNGSRIPKYKENYSPKN